MIKWLSLVVFCTSMSWALGVSDYPSQFQGYVAINKIINDRIFKPDAPIELYEYLGSRDLGMLLGVYSGTGLQLQFQNGTPNSTNMILWHLAMDYLSKDLATLCDESPQNIFRSKVNSEFLSRLMAVCQWPNLSAKSDEVLLEFWKAIVFYDAPESEFQAWKEFFLSEYNKTPAQETVAAMIDAMFLNPYFLLRK